MKIFNALSILVNISFFISFLCEILLQITNFVLIKEILSSLDTGKINVEHVAQDCKFSVVDTISSLLLQTSTLSHPKLLTIFGSDEILLIDLRL